MERNQKWKILYTLLERWTLCFSSYKNCKLKVKPWRVGAQERKKRAFFVRFILFERIFLNICVLSQCTVYWIHFRNTHTFTYHTFHLFVFVESLPCILKKETLSQVFSYEFDEIFKSTFFNRTLPSIVHRSTWLGNIIIIFV